MDDKEMERLRAEAAVMMAKTNEEELSPRRR